MGHQPRGMCRCGWLLPAVECSFSFLTVFSLAVFLLDYRSNKGEGRVLSLELIFNTEDSTRCLFMLFFTRMVSAS